MNRKKDTFVGQRMCHRDEIRKLPVHPAADRYPMMDSDGLLSLGLDMKIRQLKPIVVNDGVLIDGRNRLQAARLVGIDVWVEFHEGMSSEEVEAKIRSTADRRHLSARKRALMAVEYYDAERKSGRKVTQMYAAHRYCAAERTVKRIIANRKNKAEPKKRSKRVALDEIPLKYRPLVVAICELHRLNSSLDGKRRRGQFIRHLSWCTWAVLQFDELLPPALLAVSDRFAALAAEGD